MSNINTNLPNLSPALDPFIDDLIKIRSGLLCLSDIPKCMHEKFSTTVASIPYTISNWAVKSTGSLAMSIGSKTLSTSDWLINSSLSFMKVNQQINLHGMAKIAFDLFKQVDQTFMGYIAKNAKVAVNEFSNEKVPFSAINLIGPGLVMAWCSQKTTNNVWSALDRLKKIVTGERQKTVIFQTLDGHKFTNKENYTLKGLVKDFVIESLLAYGWWTLGDYTKEGVINVLHNDGVGETLERSQTIANALVLLGLVPAILKTLGQTFGHELNSSEADIAILGNRQMVYLDKLDFTEAHDNKNMDSITSSSHTPNNESQTPTTVWKWDNKHKQFIEDTSIETEFALTHTDPTSRLSYEGDDDSIQKQQLASPFDYSLTSDHDDLLRKQETGDANEEYDFDNPPEYSFPFANPLTITS